MHSVFIYGDSNAFGFNPQNESRFAHHDRWTTKLGNLLGSDYQIINESLNGRTTVHDTLNTFFGCNLNGRSLLVTLLNSHKPIHTIILALGTNDLNSVYLSKPSDIMNNIQVLIQDIQSQSSIEMTGNPSMRPNILILGVPGLKPHPINLAWGFPKNINAKAKELSILTETLENYENNIFYLPLFEKVPISEIDGIHYDLDQQDLLANIIHEKLNNIWNTNNLN